ncbi:MAG: hypothetical protein Q9165_002516 [Trypethelium subeluteriae]
MVFTKTYFLCPTSDLILPPPDGPLCLGAIIRSTSSPQVPLNRANVIPVVNESPPVVETNWKKTFKHESKFGFGVYAQFLQLATGGLGPEVDVERSRQRVDAFKFDTMITLAFEPTPEYVYEAIRAPSVQTYLKEHKQRFAPSVSLFLVTGMKIVKGANIKYSTSATSGIAGNLGIASSALGMTMGPKGHWTSMTEDENQFRQDSEFVFAFRVKRLKFKKKIEAEDYNKGAFLSTNEGKDDSGTEHVLIDDQDGSDIQTSNLVSDVTEDGSVYCVAASLSSVQTRSGET